MKKPYVKPDIICIKYREERGYMASYTPLSPNPINTLLELFDLDEDNNYSEMESFNQHSTWTESNKDTFWE